MTELNPINIKAIASIGFMLVISYLLGTILVGRLKSPIVSVSVKLGFGALFFISLLAVIHAGANTGMMFFVIFFLLMAWNNRFKIDFTDITDLGYPMALGLIAMFFGLLYVEGTRSDLLTMDTIYVGNSDVSFYASYGHSMYLSGFETNPENHTPEMRGAAYHFADLWFSGFFSNYFDILPYYAYQTVFRTFGLGVVLLIVFGWCLEICHHFVISLAIAITSVFAIYMELFSLNLHHISLLHPFSSVYPMYGMGSLLMIAFVVVPMSKYLAERNWFLGTVGIMLVPFLNVGLILSPLISALTLLFAAGLSKLLKYSPIKIEIKDAFLLLGVSMIPLTYYVLDNRLDSGEGNVISFEFVYLFFHTAIRATISQVMVIPFLVGFIHFWKSDDEGNRKLALVQGAFYLGTIVSFAAIFPQIQGNSTQILSLHFHGFIAPLGMVGLLGMAFSNSRSRVKVMVIVLLLSIIFQAGRVFIGSQGLRAAFDWEFYLPGHKERASIPIGEWEAIREMVNDNGVTRVGYFICDSLARGGVHYNEFNHLKGILPGIVFHRINPLATDTVLSTEMQGYFYRTSLGYFAKLHRFDSEKTVSSHMEFLQPEYLFLPKDTSRYCMPKKWTPQNKPIIETPNFTFYAQ